MSSISEEAKRKSVVPGSLKYIIAICFLSVVIPALIFMFAFLYNYYSEPVFQTLEDQGPLFVFHALTTSFLFGISVFLFGTIYVLFENLLKWITRKAIESYLNKAMKWCGYALIVSLLSMLFGAPVFNWFWYDHFESQGYSSCSGVLPLRTEIFYSVWVRNSQWCEDPEVSRILREEGHGRAGVAEVSEYLEENHVEGAREGGDAPIPPLRGPGRTD